MTSRKEFGDFQTPLPLAAEVIGLLDDLAGCPDHVIEPNAGIGAFLDAAQARWGSRASYEGFEINSAGTLGSVNLPAKTNFQGLRGFDAKTGKSNFDIAEWILIRLIEALPHSGAIGMLCKTMTARKVLRHFWKNDIGFADASLFLIDAKQHFHVAVDACLLFMRGARTTERSAFVYSDLARLSKKSEFGLIDGCLVSDVADYRESREIDGGSRYTWRSGIKHDASEIMELEIAEGKCVNGLGEKVEIEPCCLYPLLKSSDLGNGRLTPRKSVLVTQKRTGDQTEVLKQIAPRTWHYLEFHGDRLDSRKSSIKKFRAALLVPIIRLMSSLRLSGRQRGGASLAQ